MACPTLPPGSSLTAATAGEPVAVLGAQAAQLMGIDRIRPGMRISVGGQDRPRIWSYVVGILTPALSPEIDPASSVLIGFPAAEKYLHFDGHPTQIYVRTTPDDQAVTTTVDNLLGAQASPETPARSPSPSRRPPCRPSRRQGRPRHPVPRPRRGRAAGRRDRGRQHHDHLRPRASLRDRAAPGARRHPRPDPPSSSPRPSCCPWPAAPPAPSPAPPLSPPTPAATTRPPSSLPRPRPVPLPPLLSSAPCPLFITPSAPPTCPRHTL